MSLVTYGIHWSTAFSSALILACMPVFTLLILHLTRVERLRREQIVGVATACTGVVVFMSDKLLGGQWSASAGDAANPLFAELAHRTGQWPKWNFHKYLVARDGSTAVSFASKVDPLDSAFVTQLEALLAAPG